MEESYVRLILSITTTISGFVLLYFVITHLRNLKNIATKAIEHIKKMVILAKKQEQIESDTDVALRKIDNQAKEIIRDTDNRISQRYKKFNEEIEKTLQNKKEIVMPVIEPSKPEPVPLKEPISIIENTAQSTPKLLVYAGPTILAIGLLYYFLTKNRSNK